MHRLLQTQLKKTADISSDAVLDEVLAEIREHLAASGAQQRTLRFVEQLPELFRRISLSYDHAERGLMQHNRNLRLSSEELHRVKELLLPVAGARILLVEDNPINRQIAAELLSSWGMTVIPASDGREALDLLERQTFDLVFMDMQMPCRDGYETTAVIRSDSRFDMLPVVALTAHAMVADRERMIDIGTTAHVSNPLVIAELVDTLLRWLPERSGRAALPSEAVQAAGITPVPADVSCGGIDSLAGVFDLEGVLERVGNNRELLMTLLKKFRDHYEAYVGKIRTALEAGDRREAVMLAHALAGAAANMGAQQVGIAAGELENLLRRGEPVATIPALDRLEVLLAGVMAAVDQVVNVP